MEILRETQKYALNIGTLQARGLYNVSRKIPRLNGDLDLSHWFDNEERDLLMELPDKEFNFYCSWMVIDDDTVLTKYEKILLHTFRNYSTEHLSISQIHNVFRTNFAKWLVRGRIIGSHQSQGSHNPSGKRIYYTHGPNIALLI